MTQDANVRSQSLDSGGMTKRKPKPPSKALRVLAANLELLIGDGKRYASNRDLGLLPRYNPLGDKLIYRIRKLESEPGLDTLERLADATGIPMSLLLVPDMSVHLLTAEAGIRREIASIVQELLRKDALRPLSKEEIEFVAGAINLVKRPVTTSGAAGSGDVR